MISARGKIRSFVAKLFETGLAALREIFDEAAYERFLNRAGMVSSSAAYAAFRREFDEAKVRRPKCC
jgi:hypothetical protein